MDFGQLWI